MYATNASIIFGGGTLAPTGDFFVAYKTAAASIVSNQSEMVISNIIFESENLAAFHVGANTHNGGVVVSGQVDMANAEVRWRGNPNMLATKGNLHVGGNFASGLLRLPSTLTNLSVLGTECNFGGTRPDPWARPSFLDLGENPQLATFRVTNTFRYINTYCVYSQEGTVKTGFPAGLTLEIGAVGQPGNLLMGHTYTLPHRTILKNILTLRAALSLLYVGRTDNNGAGLSYTELDLSEGSVSNLEGSITRTSMSIPVLLVGAGYQGSPTGVLKLPVTMTNMSFNTLELGSQYQLNAPSNSLIHFGTNSSPVVLAVSNMLVLGYAEFVTVNQAGVASNALPAGSKLRVGTPQVRAQVQLASFSYQGTTAFFGKGIDDVRLYASNVVIGRGGWAAHVHSSTNDFRGATNFVWDVEGEFLIGTNLGNNMYVWFPAHGSGSCSNLSVGQPDSFSYNYRSFLHLSNMPFIVRQAATIKETGIISNYVNGYSSGLDIGTTNFDLQDPNISTNTAYKDYGRMDLRFAGDPVNPYRPYWGLRMKGDGRSLIQTLVTTNATFVYQRLTWSTNGLSAKAQERFGVHYDGVQNVTYIGVSPLVTGSLLIIR
jgi:hypothetical protein